LTVGNGKNRNIPVEIEVMSHGSTLGHIPNLAIGLDLGDASFEGGESCGEVVFSVEKAL
jgi:hypothetical protein